ncbi:MAG: DMT family transporter [Burkholderiaceae bacterium]
MSRVRIFVLTALTMMAFAGNSLFCRIALAHTAIDAASFTTIRLISGALMLWLLVRTRRSTTNTSGNWGSALALFIYAASLSFSYASLTTATGALLLFGAVQATMIGQSVWRGEHLRMLQLLGLVLALGGLVGLLLPGLSAPPLVGSLVMLSSGVAWGIYTLRGIAIGDPMSATAGNFLRAAPMAAVLSVLMLNNISVDRAGFLCALASGALTSGIGYAIWYTVLPHLKVAQASTVQLSVPVIAAVGGTVFLGETITLRMVLASIAILGGIALVICKSQRVMRDNPVL